SLVIRDVPDPIPARGEVLVRVSAAALNFFDTLIIQGRYQVKPAMPFSPSAEFAGVVAALGEGVTGFAIGQRVAGHSGIGAARELATIAADRLVAVPAGLSDAQAAGLFVTYGTGMHALIDRAGLKPGETLAVLGAAGGAGLAAVEIGAALGARVIACASSDDKLALASAHGAAEVLNYTQANLREGLKRLTEGRGVDVLYDAVGGDLAEPAVRSMAWGGRYLVVGFAGGDIPRIPLNLLLLKGCDLRGVFWGEFVAREPARNRDHIAQVMQWAADGRISPRVHGAFPLEEASAAFAEIISRRAVGKVVLTL
ncbi:MAG: NADPH:quinone oxidoreductase family protein, partial [Bosea sp. (in: a-proteobacteria)]